MSAMAMWPWQWQSYIASRLDRIDAKLTAINAKLDYFIVQQERAVASLADIQAAVSNETTVIGSVTTLLTQLSEQLKAAVASNDPAQIQSVVDSINANATALATAVTANTPAAPAT